MTRMGLESFYFSPIFLQRTSDDFKNNRKMPMETMQPLLSREVSQQVQPIVILPKSLQRVEFIPNFTPAYAITNSIACLVKVKISVFNESWHLAANSGKTCSSN